MKVLTVNKFINPRADAETYMLGLSRSLIADNHEVAFFCMDHKDKTDLGKTYTISKVEFGIRKSFLYKMAELVKTSVQNLSICSKLKGCYEDFKSDLIHSHNVYDQLPLSLFKDVDIPVIMTAHDYKPVCPSYNFFTKGENCERCFADSFKPCIENKCVQRSAVASSISALFFWKVKKAKTYLTDYKVYIAPSDFMKRKLVQSGIPVNMMNVVNNYTEKSVLSSATGKTLLYAGRICQGKGIDTMLKVYSLLPQSLHGLRICGTGPLKDQLEEISKKDNLDFAWLGFISPQTVKEEMNTVLAVPVPSKWNENCSMTIMESLENGRPVIVSDSDGQPELIEDSYDGYTFKSSDADHMAEKPKELLAADDKQLCNNASQTVEQRYSSEVHMKQVYEVYRDVLGKSIEIKDKSAIAS